MVSELKVAELRVADLKTLQGVGEILRIKGSFDMTSIELVEAIESEAALLLFVIDDNLLVGDLVPPF